MEKWGRWGKTGEMGDFWENGKGEMGEMWKNEENERNGVFRRVYRVTQGLYEVFTHILPNFIFCPQ